MRTRLLALLLIGPAALLSAADAGLSSMKSSTTETALSVDASASGLLPYTMAVDSPTLQHLGFDVAAGLEYETSFSMPLRLELSYFDIGRSKVASTGELYRAWNGMRLALLTGYDFSPIGLGGFADLELGILAGGAFTAAEYSSTALSYAYPSAILELRALLALKAIAGGDSGPWIALPAEFMFRSGNYTLSPGISLGWRYRITVKK